MPVSLSVKNLLAEYIRRVPASPGFWACKKTMLLKIGTTFKHTQLMQIPSISKNEASRNQIMEIMQVKYQIVLLIKPYPVRKK